MRRPDPLDRVGMTRRIRRLRRLDTKSIARAPDLLQLPAQQR